MGSKIESKIVKVEADLHMVLNFEDFTVGSKFESIARVITQEDIARFAELTGDFNSLHLDREYAKTTLFKGTIAHGLLTLGVALGLWYSLDLTTDSIVTFVGINNLSFAAPVYPGDSIHLLSQVILARESKSRIDSGLVTFKDNVINQNGKSVLEFERTFIIKKGREKAH